MKSSNCTRRTFWSCQNPVANFILLKSWGLGFQFFGAKAFFGVYVDSLKSPEKRAADAARNKLFSGADPDIGIWADPTIGEP